MLNRCQYDDLNNKFIKSYFINKIFEVIKGKFQK